MQIAAGWCLASLLSPQLPDLPEPGAVLTVVKDAARRLRRKPRPKGPGPSLTAAARGTLGNSGRDEETATVRPNKETLVEGQTLAVTTRAKQQGGT